MPALARTDVIAMQARSRRPLATAIRQLAPLLLAALAAAGAAGQDLVPVPSGPASFRRLFGLDPARPDAAFFLDLNEVLLFGSSEATSWSSVETRRRATAFAVDVAAWRQIFGDPARFAASPAAERARTARALDWLGFTVRDDGAELETERRNDETSLRRQSFLDAIGTPTAAFLARLRAGEAVEISAGDATAPLPFGLEAWRETLSEPGLTVDNAFLFFVQNIRASRMLVALHGLDPETREGLRGLLRDSGGRPLGWKMLYDEVLEPFSRYPEALRLRDGRFLLPGGAEAEPIWTATFGVPSDRAAFLNAFYTADGEKGAYVVDTLQHLREEEARELLFGQGAGPDSAKRFRNLYRAIDSGGADYASTRRDPYDFAHLAAFLAASPPPGARLPAASTDDAKFPRDEAELVTVLARGQGSGAASEESLQRLLRQGSNGRPGEFSAQRKFLFLSGLVARRPDLADPGLELLLDRGFDRFSTAYAILADFPFSGPELARRYLFTLDRLDRPAGGRDAELRAGLFQGYVVLLADFARVGTLEPPVAAELFSSLLDVPLFAGGSVAPGQGEAGLFAWLSSRLLPALRSRGRAGEKVDSDEMVAKALGGPPAPAVVGWRGGRYRFDPIGDETSRRRAFRETQSLAGLSDLETLHRERDAALSAAGAGDLAAARATSAELALALRLAAPGTPRPGHDERIERTEDRAREAAEDIAAISNARELARVSAAVPALDALLAERHLEAVLGHVYSASARDPNDLYYQDPDFVARHSFRTVERAGAPIATAFTKTALVKGERGGGFLVSGSLFGLPEVLGLLHADQLTYRSGAGIPTEEFRSGLVAPIWQMNAARLDDDSLEVVAACVRATVELADTLAPFAPPERFEVWDGVARDLVPRSRLALLASLPGEPDEEALSPYLSPSDLYRIGRRLLLQTPTSSRSLPSALRAREAMARLDRTHGEAGARERLAEFGPCAEAYTGRPGLSDLDLPPYERLAAYRRPRILAERLYDMKIAAASRLVEAELPAAVLPIVLPAALDTMLTELRMAYPYDWSATTRAAAGFSAGDLERILDEAVDAGRLVRDGDSSSEPGGGS